MERREAERALHLGAARVTGGEAALLVALRVDLALPRQLEDAQRVLLVRDLMAVSAAHATAAALHDLERYAERAEDLRPLRRRPGHERLLRAVRQQAVGGLTGPRIRHDLALVQPLFQ